MKKLQRESHNQYGQIHGLLLILCGGGGFKQKGNTKHTHKYIYVYIHTMCFLEVKNLEETNHSTQLNFKECMSNFNFHNVQQGWVKTFSPLLTFTPPETATPQSQCRVKAGNIVFATKEYWKEMCSESVHSCVQFIPTSNKNSHAQQPGRYISLQNKNVIKLFQWYINEALTLSLYYHL